MTAAANPNWILFVKKAISGCNFKVILPEMPPKVYHLVNIYSRQRPAKVFKKGIVLNDMRAEPQRMPLAEVRDQGKIIL